MTRLLVLAVAVATTSPVALAQAPVPDALRTAREIYLVNASADGRALDELAKRLREWKSVALVDAQDKADDIATLSLGGTGDTVAVPLAGIIVAASEEAWVLTIREPGTDTPLYADREMIGGFSRYGGLKNLVERLRRRIRQEQ